VESAHIYSDGRVGSSSFKEFVSRPSRLAIYAADFCCKRMEIWNKFKEHINGLTEDVRRFKDEYGCYCADVKRVRRDVEGSNEVS
jgi:hypothetical protein